MCELITKAELKRKIKENTALYKKQKAKVKGLFENMLMAKTALKNYQIIYWEEKSLRDNVTFIKLYADIKSIYNQSKNKYVDGCRNLKRYKNYIKERNRELGKINHG